MQTTTLQLRLLGWPKVMVTGKTAVPSEAEVAVPDFSSLKVQAILFYLAVTRHPTSREKLISLLWPDVPQQKARTSLRSALYNFQHALPDVLVVTRKQVSLSPTCTLEVDVTQFETEIAVQEVTAVRCAVALYAGDFLEGFTIEDAPEFDYWLLVEQERLRHKMLAGLTWLIEQETAVSNLSEAAQLLRRLLALEPWREEAHRQLMHLLARQGQYNAALRQYRQCEQILVAEFGAPPMPETTTLHKRIQQLRQTPPADNLPALPDGLIGRETAVSELQKRLRDSAARLLTITGPGGVGKTRLALAVATANRCQFMDGVYYVPLTAVSQPQFLVTAIAEAIGFAFSGQDAPQQQLLTYLRPREMLLLLDNFEHLLDGAPLLSDMLLAAPSLILLLTSREPLQLRAEWVCVLAGLPYPATDAPPVEEYAAVQLFARRARQVCPSFDLEQTVTAVTRICRLLAGLPLGLELAAALTTNFSCTQIAAEIERNLDVLQAAWPDAPSRHRSLHALFDHTWQSLTLPQQEVFCRLSVLRGHFTVQEAQAVAKADGHMLRTLAAKSLLQRVRAETETATSASLNAAVTRYALHETLRQYGAKKLATDPESETAVRRRHAAYFTTLLDRETAVFAQETMPTVAAELDNIRVAWEWAARAGDFVAIGCAMYALHQFYEARNWFQEGRAMFAQAETALAGQLDETNGTQQVIWGRLLGHYAALLWRGGQLQEALPLAQQSADILRREAAVSPLLFSLNVLGVLHIYGGDFEAAATVLQECAQTARQTNDPLQWLKPLANLGSVYMRTGNYEAGKAVLQEGLMLARQVGDRRGLGFFLNNLGTIAMLQEDMAVALIHLEECLDIARETDNKYVEMIALLNLGEIKVGQEQLAEAEQLCQESVAISQKLGDNINTARSLKWLALAQHGQGQRDEAWQQVRQALALLDEAAEPARLYVLAGTVQILADEGRQDEAVELAAYIQQHPAAETQSVDSMTRLLSQLGINQPPQVDRLPEAWR